MRSLPGGAITTRGRPAIRAFEASGQRRARRPAGHLVRDARRVAYRRLVRAVKESQRRHHYSRHEQRSDHMLPEMRPLAAAGIGGAGVDWPGFGDSEGPILWGGAARGALSAAVDWLAREPMWTPIVSVAWVFPWAACHDASCGKRSQVARDRARVGAGQHRYLRRNSLLEMALLERMGRAPGIAPIPIYCRSTGRRYGSLATYRPGRCYHRRNGRPRNPIIDDAGAVRVGARAEKRCGLIHGSQHGAMRRTPAPSTGGVCSLFLGIT